MSSVQGVLHGIETHLVPENRVGPLLQQSKVLDLGGVNDNSQPSSSRRKGQVLQVVNCREKYEEAAILKGSPKSIELGMSVVLGHLAFSVGPQSRDVGNCQTLQDYC